MRNVRDTSRKKRCSYGQDEGFLRHQTAYLRGFYSAYLPNKVVAGRAQEHEEAARLALLHADRPAREGTATAYICVNYAWPGSDYRSGGA